MKLVAAKTVATVATAGLLTFGLAAPASAQTQRGGAAGLIAAVVQLQNVEVRVVNLDDVNVAVENVLNNNRILNEAFQNFLNRNNVDVDINDVIDVNVLEDGTVVVVI